jgi:trimeric autotransporter adhesin
LFSVASGYGITGGTITTTGTLRLDSASVYNYIRDSIVDVQIGNDTIKILKQEYNNATSDTLVWTTTVKFPIQLRAYILLFRNGQLLINDQFTVIDTNKIKIAATSYKLGENYTLVTVSGIGSAGVSETGNPVYPEAGIALSTGTTWTTSITNNSSNWNTAYSDRLKWDGGNTGLVAATGRTSLGGTTIGQSMFTLTNPSAITFPRFNSDNTITARSAANFRSDIGAGSVTTVTVAAGTPLSIQNTTTTPEISMAAASGSVNGYLSSTDWTTFNNKQNALSNASASVSGILTSTDWSTFNGKQNALTNPVTGTGISSFLPRFTGTSTLDSTRIFYSSGRLGINMDASEATSHLTSRFVIRDFGHNFKFDGSAAGSGYTTTFSHDDTGLKIGQSSNIRDIRFTLNGTSGLTISNNSNSPARAVGIGNDSPSHQLDVTGTFRATGATTLGSTLAVTGAITEGGNNVLTNLDTASLSSRIDLKLNKTDTASLSTRIDGKVSLTATESISGTKTFNNLVNITNQMSISGSVSGGNQLLGKNSSNNGVADITLGTGLSITSNVLNAAIPTERYYFDLGTVAGQADNVTGTYNFSYSGNAFIVPSSLNGYCIDTVNIRAISCTDCPPAAGEKDYYMGVYKVSAGNRVTSTGATMQGSQIVCNEYDLKQENVNHVLTTGDVWWVYLNGSYFSDMEIIKASFIVKKTCN